ncbi:MAG: sulfatase [Acidobacteriota bacterium]
MNISASRATIASPLLVALLACAPAEQATLPLSDVQRLRQSLPVAPGVNVIVVSFDALRPDVLGLYGSERGTSPALDEFAERSIVFERAYTVAPVTPTSFAGVFTGLLPVRVFHDWHLVYEDTLAARFAAGGYRTAAFLNNAQLTPERNFHVGFDTYKYFRSIDDGEVLDQALSWLKQHEEESVFAWIHFLTPHAPYDRMEIAQHFYDPEYEGQFEETSGSRFTTEDPAEIARLWQLYEGEVFYGDTLFARFLEALETSGLLQRSVVVVTSDHGEEFFEHGDFQHGRLTEEHVRIPLLIYHPEVQSELRTQLPVTNMDLYPTLLSVAGQADSGLRDGRDLTRLNAEPPYTVGVSLTGARARWLSLRKGRYKLIETCMLERQRRLFDLEADPGEQHDIHLENREVASRLYQDLGQIMGGDPCEVMQAAANGQGPTVGMSQENIDALKALGYLSD